MNTLLNEMSIARTRSKVNYSDYNISVSDLLEHVSGVNEDGSVNVYSISDYIYSNAISSRIVVAVKRFVGFRNKLHGLEFSQFRDSVFSVTTINRFKKLFSNVNKVVNDVNELFYTLWNEVVEYSKTDEFGILSNDPAVTYSVRSYSNLNIAHLHDLLSMDCYGIGSPFVFEIVRSPSDDLPKIVVSVSPYPDATLNFAIDDGCFSNVSVDVNSSASRLDDDLRNAVLRDYKEIGSNCGLKFSNSYIGRNWLDYSFSFDCGSDLSGRLFLYCVVVSLPVKPSKYSYMRLSLVLRVVKN